MRGLRDDVADLNLCGGAVTEEHVATALGYDYVDPAVALEENCRAAG